MKILPDDENQPLWVRLALTDEQIAKIDPDKPFVFSGTASVQYVSKHDVGNRRNVEIRLIDLSFE
jgi:hypothetical protein